MTTTIKKSLGDAGAFLDESHGSDTLYKMIKSLATTLNDLITSHNQLIIDYNAETSADHTDSTASAVTPDFTIE
jgi:hypothetical protein